MRAIGAVCGVTLLAAALPAAQVTAAEPAAVTLSPHQALGLAKTWMNEGRVREAAALLRSLTVDPNAQVRDEARWQLSQLLAKAGKLAEGATQLRRLVDDQPAAAGPRVSLAALLLRLDDADGARRQLRAARTLVRSAEDMKLLDRLIATARSRARSGWSLDVAVAPDSNINQATRDSSLGTIIGDFTIDENARAKSGTGLALRGSAFRRMALSEQVNLLARTSASADLYVDKRFRRFGGEVAIGPEFSLGKTQLSAEIALGQNWFGGKPVQRTVRIGGAAYRPIGPVTGVGVRLSAAQVDNRQSRIQGGHAYSAGLVVDRALGAATAVQLSAGLGRFDARDAGYSNRTWELGGAISRDLGPWTLSGSATVGGLRADERLNLFPNRREDKWLRLSAGVTARQVNLLGFAPSVRVTHQRNRSNIAIWDSRRTRVEWGLSRAF